MSSRAVRKRLEAEGKLGIAQPVQEDTDSSNEEASGDAPANPFALLLGSGDNEDESSEEVVETKKAPKKNKGKGAKAKGKGKEKRKVALEIEPVEDIDEILEKFTTPVAPKAIVVAQKHLFDLQPKKLNSKEELKRMFGSEIVRRNSFLVADLWKLKEEKKAARRQPMRPHARGNRAAQTWAQHRKTTLVKAKNNWPPLNNQLSMKLVDSIDGINYFCMQWSDDYKHSQDQFYAAVNTGDPNSLAHLLQGCPYQIDAMLQLSEACKQTGELDMAVDLIERILYRFETAWHHLFNPITSHNVRFEYKHPTNRSFFLAIFRHIQMLGRRGCPETALEYCKLLLKMDPSDPLRVLLLIDVYSIRCKSYNYLLELFFNSHLFRVCGSSSNTATTRKESEELEVRSQALELDLLPNLLFSCALAKYRLELESNVNTKEYKLDSGKVVGTSDELLQHAILMFPSLLSPLLQRNGVEGLRVLSNDGSTDLLYHSFLQNSKDYDELPLLNQLVTLYVDTAHLQWKDDRVLEWLKPNLEVVIKRVEADDTMVVNCKKIVIDHYSDSSHLDDTQRHILLTEHSQSLQTLPPDVLNEGVRIYDDDGQPARRQDDQANPLLLFLQSLMPWFNASGGDQDEILAQVAQQFGFDDEWEHQ